MILPHEKKHYTVLLGARARGEALHKSETFFTKLLFKGWEINRGCFPDILGAAIILQAAQLTERSGKASLTRIC